MPFIDLHTKRAQIRAEQPECEVRQLVGDGTHELFVDGLTELQYCRVGDIVLPLTKTWTYLANQAGTKRETETLPFVQVYTDEDGRQILLRDISSNHGVWQKGAPIFVGGVWDPKSKTGARITAPLPPRKEPGQAAPPPATPGE